MEYADSGADLLGSSSSSSSSGSEGDSWFQIFWVFVLFVIVIYLCKPVLRSYHDHVLMLSMYELGMPFMYRFS